MTNIRRANTKDIKGVTGLFDSYRVFYGKASDMEGAEKFIWERLAQDDSVIYVAETETNDLIGFVQLYPIFSSTRMKRLWLLNDLYIDTRHRGKGISKQLIEISKMLCVEVDACGLILETAKTNDIGNSLYPKAGFVLDTEHNYYSWDRPSSE